MSPRDMLTERQANILLTPSHLLESITEPPKGSVAYKVRAFLHKKAEMKVGSCYKHDEVYNEGVVPNTITPPMSEWKLEDMV